MTSHERDRAVYGRFLLGALIGAAMFSTLLLRPFLFPPSLPVGRITRPVPLTSVAILMRWLPTLGFFVGGAVAGTALKRSIGAVVGFGVAFAIGDSFAMLTIVSTQGMHMASFFQFTIAYSVVFGFAGLIGLLGAGVRGSPLARGILGFAAGGCATVILLSVLMKVGLFGGSLLRVTFTYAIGMTLPWILGIASFIEGLKRERRTAPIPLDHD